MKCSDAEVEAEARINFKHHRPRWGGDLYWWHLPSQESGMLRLMNLLVIAMLHSVIEDVLSHEASSLSRSSPPVSAVTLIMHLTNVVA
jgi:hypothetical protein